jgi:hypothetical protein
VDLVVGVHDLCLPRKRAARALPDHADPDAGLDPEDDRAPRRAGREPDHDHGNGRQPDDHHESEHLGLGTERIVHLAPPP